MGRNKYWPLSPAALGRTNYLSPYSCTCKKRAVRSVVMLFMKGRRVVAEPVRNRKKERNNSLLLPANKIVFLVY
jgi:hypothetical protein